MTGRHWCTSSDPGSSTRRTCRACRIRSERRWSTQWWARRGIQAGAVTLAWLALYHVARRPGSLAPAPAAATAVVAAALAFALLRLIFFRLANAATWYGVMLRGTPAGLALLGAGYAVTRTYWPANRWADLVGAVLITAAGMALCYFILMSPLVVWGLIVIRRHWRRCPREDILDDLLGLLDDLADPGSRNDLDQRSSWMWWLEHAATTMEKRLPRSLNPYDKATLSWASERARGAATALRQLKRQIAAPADRSWDRLTAALGNEVVALATGDLAKLRWAPPPSPETIRRSRWKTAIGLLRTLALAAAPLAAVIAIQPLLHLDAQPLRWAKL